MRKLFRFWNFIFFCLYNLQLNFHKVVRHINPIYYLQKTKLVKGFFAEKRGIEDVADHIDKSVFYNTTNGIPIHWANIHIGNISVLLEILCFNVYQFVIKRNLLDNIMDNPKYLIIAFIVFISPMAIFNYFVLSKNKIYLKYFEEFNKISAKKIYMYCVLCAIGYLVLVVLVIMSFTWLR